MVASISIINKKSDAINTASIRNRYEPTAPILANSAWPCRIRALRNEGKIESWLIHVTKLGYLNLNTKEITMSKELQNLEMAEAHLLEMRNTLAIGVENPEKAAQCACAALLTMVDLLDAFVQQGKDDAH